MNMSNKPKYNLEFIDTRQRKRFKTMALDLGLTMNECLLETIEEALEKWERGELTKKTMKRRC